MRQTCIFSGSSHPKLTDSICERLGRQPDDVDLRKFANGETSVEIKTSVRDQNVFIVQSGSSKINDSVMELLIMISACKSGSARSITAVVPYFPYSRQSKRKSHRGAITARMLANLMNVAGVTHVITIDLHASQSQGFFKCPVDNLVAEPILAKWIKANVKDWQKAVVVSKNPGGTKRVTSLADALQLSFGIVTTDRRRPLIHNSMENSAIFGSQFLDGANEVLEEDAEAHIFPAEPANITNMHHDSDQSVNERDFEAHPRRAGLSRPSTTIPYHSANRTSATSIHSSPLKHATHSDESESPDTDSVVEANTRSNRGSNASLQTMNSILGTTQPHPALTYDSDDEDNNGEEYNDERARDVVTGRLIQGHLVEDDAASPSVSNSYHPHQHRHSDDDPPEHMLTSFMSTASSHRITENGLGGTADATASDEEEEQALHDPDLEHTITLVGNVRNRPVFIVDDIIDKAGSWIAAAETAVKRGGATQVFCMATHGLFGGSSLQELQECHEIDKIIVTNSFPISEEMSRGVTKLVVLDVSNLLSEAIRRNNHGESISQLFMHYD